MWCAKEGLQYIGVSCLSDCCTRPTLQHQLLQKEKHTRAGKEEEEDREGEEEEEVEKE